MCNNEDNNYLVLSMMKENIKGNKKEYSNIKLQKKKNKDRIYLEAKYGPQKSSMIIGIEIASDDQLRLEQLQKQASIDLNNDHILRLIQSPFARQLTINDKKSTYLLIPLSYSKTSLLKKYGQLKKEEEISIMLQLATTVAFLHQNQQVHGKINPQNIYIKNKGIAITPPEPAFCRKKSYSTLKTYYDSPQQCRYNESADIWSLGIVFYEIVMGAALSSIKQIKLSDKKAKYPLNEHKYSMKPLMIRLLAGMLQPNPANRYDIKIVVKFLEEIKKDRFNYRLLLLEQERDEFNELNRNRNEKLEQVKPQISDPGIRIIKRETQKRVVLNNHLLSLMLDPQEEILHIQILFKKDLFAFMTIEYRFDQLPQRIQAKWRNLQSLFFELTEKNKDTIRFLSTGVLEFQHEEQAQDNH